MSHRTDIHHRLHSLSDIKGILRAMKNLSFIETRKLMSVVPSQETMEHSIAEIADDFFGFYGARKEAETVSIPPLYVAIGSERGFCGDFNERILRTLETEIGSTGISPLILVGSKLAKKWPKERKLPLGLPGPNVVEELPAVVAGLIERIRDVTKGEFPLLADRVIVVHNREEGQGVRSHVLRPFDAFFARGKKRFSYPPELNLTPDRFAADLAVEYLLTSLYTVFCASLMAEHRQRIKHMESALRRLERECSELVARENSLRQEEITQEIEMILLGAESKGGA